MPALPASQEQLRTVRERLEALDVANIGPGMSGVEVSHAELHPLLAPYRTGLLSARLGDGERVRSALDELRSAPAPSHAPDAPEILERSMRAYAAWREERTELALEELRALDGRPLSRSTTASVGSPLHARALDRYLEAMLLEETEPEAALGFYDTIGELINAEWVLRAPAQARIAAIHERLGNLPQAIERYELLIELWKDCDPELRPRVVEARARVAELRGRRPADSPATLPTEPTSAPGA
jgi:tetratricopeptide (TPR) repeat protein